MFVTQPVPITAATRPKELKLSVWDTKNGSCLRQYPMRTIDDLRATARSSDSYVFADIGNCRFWPLGTCLSMSHAPKWSAQIRNSLVMSPDGFFFVAAPNYNVVYETSSQRPVCHLPLGRRNRPIMFSPTGRYLVSSSADDETLITNRITVASQEIAPREDEEQTVVTRCVAPSSGATAQTESSGASGPAARTRTAAPTVAVSPSPEKSAARAPRVSLGQASAGSPVRLPMILKQFVP